MKNIKLMSFLFVLLQSGLVFSSEKCVGFENMPLVESQRAIYDEFTPVNLMDRENNPSTSKVGFYNGDLNKYRQALLAQYPDDSCLQRYVDTNKVYKDCTSNQRYEHVMQDTLIQRKISNDLGSIHAVRNKYLESAHSTYWWKNIAYFGFAGNSKLENLENQVLVQKVSDFRAQKYQELLKDFYYISIAEKKSFAEQNKGKAAYPALHQEYEGLRDKVKFNLETEALIQEKYFYQRVITLTWMTLGAASIGGYLWATKK